MTPAASNRPRVSVVVPSWNAAPLLRTCLQAVRAQRHVELDLVVVDNGSQDGSVAVARREAPLARVIELDRNRGFAAAANLGAAAAQAPYVAFLNSDAEPAPDWLKELAATLERRPRAAAAEPKTLRRDAPNVLDGAGLAMTASLKAYRRGAGEEDVGQYDVEEEVFAASATACLWRADVFRELGGFDESFFAYYEDVDLGFRARRAGYEAWYSPRAVVRHAGGASARHLDESVERLSVRNRWHTVAKNAPRRWLIGSAPVLVLGEAMWLARSLAAGSGRAHLAAYREIARSAGGWLAERRPARPLAEPPGVAKLVSRSFPPVRPLGDSDGRRARRHPLRRPVGR